MQGDITKYVSSLIHKLNVIVNISDDLKSQYYNEGLAAAKAEARELLKRWKEIEENS